MRFGWFLYIIGIVAIGIAIGFLTPISEFAAISLMILLPAWSFLFPFIMVKKAMKKSATEYDQLTELAIKATIISKEIAVREFIHNSDNSCYVSEITYHNITFRTETHNQWIFDVSKELFDILIEGDEGILSYKQIEQQFFFVSFIRHG